MDDHTLMNFCKKFKKNGFNCFMYDPLLTKEQNSTNNFLHKLDNTTHLQIEMAY